MLSRTGVVSGMVRLLISIANKAAQEGAADPSREDAAVFAALTAALSRLASRGPPQLGQAIGTTPGLIPHAIYLLDSPIVDSTKASLIALLNAFLNRLPSPALRAAVMNEKFELGPVLVKVFLQIEESSGESIIKHTSNALVPFVQEGTVAHTMRCRFVLIFNSFI